MKAKGMRRTVLAGGKLHVFSNAKRIIVQVRAAGPDHDPLVTWAKAAASLSRADALQLAAELLNVSLEQERTVNKPPPAPSAPSHPVKATPTAKGPQKTSKPVAEAQPKTATPT
jgi:hypothetical protein